MEKSCWWCLENLSSDDLTAICKNCGADNDRTPYTELTKPPKEEVEMPFEKQDKTDSIYLKLPRQGDSYDFSVYGEVINIEKVANPDGKKGFNFVKKIQVTTPDGKLVQADDDQGYFYLITFTDGKKLSLSSWSPFFAMRDAGIIEGCKFKVEHKDKGEWIVTKL